MKRKRAIKLSVIVTAVLALVILSGAACYAANDISKTNVTGLSIENVDPGSVLESGSTQKVKLTFRDNDSHAIETGIRSQFHGRSRAPQHTLKDTTKQFR